MAWSTGISLLTLLDESQIAEWGDSDDFSEFWKVSQPTLANAFAMVQQAQEMALKGRVAEVSPFLLITGEIREWPKQCDKRDVPFSEFRTPNASDLIRMHDAVCTTKLAGSFSTLFETVRRKRNIIKHQAKFNERLETMDILLHVLETFKHLFPESFWPKTRRTYLSIDPASILAPYEYAPYQMAYEFALIVDDLKPKDLKRFYGFNKKQRRYMCPNCHSDMRKYSEPDMFAQLRPNSPSSSTIYCVLCQQETDVLRKACSDKECKSNVIAADPEIGICLLCLEENSS